MISAVDVPVAVEVKSLEGLEGGRRICQAYQGARVSPLEYLAVRVIDLSVQIVVTANGGHNHIAGPPGTGH